MKRIVSFAVVGLLLTSTTWVSAEDLKSGPQPGDFVGAFTVEKCAGNESDGVETGEQLCYRCKLRNRPVVAVFAHTPDASLAKLVKEIDGVVAKHADKDMAAFVNLLGEDASSLKAKAAEVVAKSGAKKVAVVVPSEHKAGPANYNLNPEADVTVVVYREGKVKANFAVPAGGLKDSMISDIAKSAVEMLN